MSQDANEYRSCLTKIRHETYYGAYLHLWRGLKDLSLDIYLCVYCGKYHVGHGTTSSTRATRIKLLSDKRKIALSIDRHKKKIEKDRKALKNFTTSLVARNALKEKIEMHSQQIERLEEAIDRINQSLDA